MDSTHRPPRPPRPHLALGRLGEDLVAEHLAAQGWQVLARNWRVAAGELRGELDLVCRDGDAVVVVEVKTRGGRGFGAPVEAVDRRKQARIRRLAAAFLAGSGVRSRQVRFDVVGVLVHDGGGDGRRTVRIDHVRGAF